MTDEPEIVMTSAECCGTCQKSRENLDVFGMDDGLYCAEFHGPVMVWALCVEPKRYERVPPPELEKEIDALCDGGAQ